MPRSRGDHFSTFQTNLILCAGSIRPKGMTFCGDLYISCVIAASAGVIRFPADLGTRCRFCFVMLEVMTEGFAVLSTANFAFCGVGARRGAAAMAGLIVDLVAAAAFVPMRGAVRRPLFGPIMAERGAFVRSRIGDFAAIALCGLRAVLGTRCIVVRDIVRKAMTEGRNGFIRCIIAVFARFVWLPAFRRTSRILTEVRYRFVAKRLYQYRAAFSTRLRCRTRCGCARRMARSGNLSIRRVFAAGTRFIVVPSCFSTRCGLTVIVFEIMAECRNC